MSSGRIYRTYFTDTTQHSTLCPTCGITPTYSYSPGQLGQLLVKIHISPHLTGSLSQRKEVVREHWIHTHALAGAKVAPEWHGVYRVFNGYSWDGKTGDIYVAVMQYAGESVGDPMDLPFEAKYVGIA